MIPYEPRPIRSNVNVSETGPLKDFFALSAGLIAVVVAVYFLLGLLVEIIVPQISPRLEVRLGQAFNQAYLTNADRAASARLQPVLDELIKGLPSSARRLDYRLVVANEKAVNAVALPGGTILVYRGLLDKLGGEDELSFVLGHELGHFYHRDHLKGLGRGLLVMLVSLPLAGETGFSGRELGLIEMRFSQQQELAADRFGFDLVRLQTGQTAGAVNFMLRLARETDASSLSYYFASHPHPAVRLAQLEARQREVR